jgi:hypothetical protein
MLPRYSISQRHSRQNVDFSHENAACQSANGATSDNESLHTTRPLVWLHARALVLNVAARRCARVTPRPPDTKEVRIHQLINSGDVT